MTATDPEVEFRPETAGDRPAIREVHARAFGDAERVPALVDALRAAPAPLAPVSLVATDAGRVVGHVMLSHSRLDAPSRIVDVFTLSPLGVLPEYHRRGIGTRLIDRALAAAGNRRVPLVFLEGSPEFYRRRGFADATTVGFRPPSLRYPPGAFHVMRLEAYEPWMTGTFVYADPFWALDCVGLRGERLRAMGVEL